MPRLYANNYITTLNGAITDSATSITVNSVTGLPTVGSGDTCLLTIDDGSNVEIVEVTSASGVNLTVVRGVEGTTGTAFADAVDVEMRATAGSLVNDRTLGDEILSDSPLGYWVANDASGTIADSSGNGNTLTVTGSVDYEWTNLVPKSRDDKHLKIQGGSNYAAASDDIGITVPLNVDWTFECMVMLLEDNSTDNHKLFTFTAPGETEAANYQAYCYLTADGFPGYFWEYSTGSNETQTGVIASLPKGQVAHVAFVKDGSANTVTFYLNGRKTEVLTYTNEPTGGSSVIFALGDSTTSTSAFVIGEAALYESALSEARIQDHADAVK